MNKKQLKKIVDEKWFSAPISILPEVNQQIPIQLDSSLSNEYRSIIDRDRDRILYSKTFRRLNGKTQIFIPRSNDYVRTRLTHTLEVNQIARSIGKGLGLNISLIEAIAMGHDVGHTPFGHAGEYELNRIMNNCLYHSCSGFPKLGNDNCGFKHNFQAIRVLCELEYIYGQKGLGLTPFTLWGILNHTKLEPKICEYADKNQCPRKREMAICLNKNKFSLDFYNSIIKEKTTISDNPAWSFEGIVVNIADEFAQIHHDIEDGLFMNIITLDEVYNYIDEFFSLLITDLKMDDAKNNYDSIKTKIASAKDQRTFMSFASKLIIDFLISKFIRDTSEIFERLSTKFQINSRESFISHYNQLGSSKEFSLNGNKLIQNEILDNEEGMIKVFKDKFKNRVINSEEVQQLNNLGYKVISDLFEALYLNPKILNDKTLLAFVEESEDAKQIMRDTGLYRLRTDEGKFKTRQKEGLGEIRNKMSELINNFDDDDKLSNNQNAITLMRIVADHISGMTDGYALAKHKEIYGSNFGL